MYAVCTHTHVCTLAHEGGRAPSSREKVHRAVGASEHGRANCGWDDMRHCGFGAHLGKSTPNPEDQKPCRKLVRTPGRWRCGWTRGQLGLADSCHVRFDRHAGPILKNMYNRMLTFRSSECLPSKTTPASHNPCATSPGALAPGSNDLDFKPKAGPGASAGDCSAHDLCTKQ